MTEIYAINCSPYDDSFVAIFELKYICAVRGSPLKETMALNDAQTLLSLNDDMVAKNNTDITLCW